MSKHTGTPAKHMHADESESRPSDIRPRGGSEIVDKNHRLFDDIARSMAGAGSRRDAFRYAVMGLAGLALTKLGVKTAWAASNCLCNGVVYDSSLSCCTTAGVVHKHPIASLASCPTRVPNATHTCVPNGCGGDGGIPVPNGYLAADFRPSCNAHDCCYDACTTSGTAKATCDTNLRNGLNAACSAAYPGTGLMDRIKRSTCQSTASTYYSFVTNYGQQYFDAAQQQSCDCCGTQPCTTCAGSACGSLPRCSATNPDCLCFTTPEGAGACIPGSTPCAGLTTCTSSAQCPPGYGCTATSCCGSVGVCGPLCTDVTPAAMALARGNYTGPTMGGSGNGSLRIQ
jgi:hypothetical protein